MEQTPAPGARLSLVRGETLTFRLRTHHATGGMAWLRTNLGAAKKAHGEIIDAVETRRARLARDWHDWPMIPAGPGEFEVRIPVAEVGHFEAKTFYQSGVEADPQWPDGDNVSISVSPSHLAGANGIYNAFVRQFGKRRPSRAARHRDYRHIVDARQATVTGPSGTFRDLIERLDFIFGDLGCRHLLLMPVFPVPAVYGRMGLYGSPYATTDFFAIEPALAQFDRAATPMQQFQELVDGVHQRQGYLLLDIAVNHCGWGAAIHARHPEWVVRDGDRTMRSPGAWGVTWHDLTALDFENRDLWRYVADVLLFWCRRGVDGFRCDAGYMIPADAWEYIIAKVRDQYPDTLFLLEGLGGKISVTRDLMQYAGFDCAYSELFQQYTDEQIASYTSLAHDISRTDGMLVNFAETHDNNRLAAQSVVEARLRTALAALLSHRGAFAFANGVEWFATEKIDVHGNSDLNWGASLNQVGAIARLNLMLRRHPAFYGNGPMRWVHTGQGKALALLRGEPSDRDRLLVLANLDTRHPATVTWHAAECGIGGEDRNDALSRQPVSLTEHDGGVQCRLEPGAVVCLPGEPERANRLLEDRGSGRENGNEPARVLHQRAVAIVQTLSMRLRNSYDCGLDDVEGAAQQLLDDPERMIGDMVDGGEDMLVRWRWPRDTRREVMVPPGHFLYVNADHPFRAELRRDPEYTLGAETSMPAGDGSHFAIMAMPTSGRGPAWRKAANSRSILETAGTCGDGSCPDNVREIGEGLLCRGADGAVTCGNVSLWMRVFEPQGMTQAKTTVRFLPSIDHVCLPSVVGARDLPTDRGIVLRTNRRGGMMRAATDWGNLYSRYDALLAANLHPEHPVDRQVLLTRYRAWVAYRGHSHDLNRTCLVAVDDRAAQSVRWRFAGPFALADEWIVDITLSMAETVNALRLTAVLHPADDRDRNFALSGPMYLVLRPDVEDRNFHADTLAYTGPEWGWKDAVHGMSNGFDFAPHPQRTLRVTASAGQFVEEPEWQYQVPHPVEAERGMRPAADLFSPGYFKIPLEPATARTVDAIIMTEPGSAGTVDWPAVNVTADGDPAGETPDACKGAAGLAATLAESLRAYIVRRGRHRTVIAGYPWFLDWGRDTLIVARGLLRAGMQPEVEAILKQFALFEQGGTLPNMIRGDDARDRDTSDAPLWFVKVCAECAFDAGPRRLLEQAVGERTLFEVVQSIMDNYRKGTANGIRVDADSGLVFSPSHFTWMDTNFPAATPRQGYPVEIQALWHAALRFMADVTGTAQWRDAANQVRQSIMELFYQERLGYFSDCLHAEAGQTAREADADDALRPNQLFLLTLDVLDDVRYVCRRMLAACSELVVPGGCRSLADRPVTHAIPVSRHGRLLNDPQNPYQGRYEGDEDTRRKPAYHNGTAWGWLYPNYAEAWWKTYGHPSRETALAYLAAVAPRLREVCLRHLPELLDGDAPHRQKGCDAQAWSVSETFRVLRQIQADF